MIAWNYGIRGLPIGLFSNPWVVMMLSPPFNLPYTVHCTAGVAVTFSPGRDSSRLPPASDTEVHQHNLVPAVVAEEFAASDAAENRNPSARPPHPLGLLAPTRSLGP